jgi:hypothetical protein
VANPSPQLKDIEQPTAASAADHVGLREVAVRTARSCGWLPNKRSRLPRRLFLEATKRFNRLERRLYNLKSGEPTEDVRALYENLRLIRTDVRDLNDAMKLLSKLPVVRTGSDEPIPRCLVLATGLLSACVNDLSESQFTYFLEAVQEVEPLRLAEVEGMLPALKLAIFEALVDAGEKALEAFLAAGLNAPSFGIPSLIRSFRLIGDLDWKEILEQLSFVHRTLLLDPSGVYPRMDFESRELYRQAVETIAAHSDVSEIELARRAVQRAARQSPLRTAPEALTARLKHVGYYLIDEAGSKELRDEIGYRPSLPQSVQQLFRHFPDEIYIIGIEFLSLITVVALIMSVVRTNGGWGVAFGALLLLLPATQAAVEIVNYLVTTVLRPHILPKIDFSKGVDASCATMVAIPTLLINEKQIRQLVEGLEVRYLVNRDPNVFYALLTDLPDTAEPAEEQDHRIELVVRLIDELNAKYADEPFGGFYLFHRHRIYNPREGAWMGWERKRGKLLDLNQLLRHVYDPFPVKAGDASRLPFIRYVLTLDSDTELPRGSAQHLIGAMAHPLNRPLIDPELNIVTEGYGILQPRVGISVRSSTRSRLASIYSGQTGFDIYSRAISDVYQDLYGEGIFTGKGIYDIDALRQVLEHRFPRNALLSHDLIEGAYARAGLVSDTEVIDDYPSHYSAYNRRRHRWLRGDWQIVRWIFNRVPDESRRLVQNPTSLVSRWKIADNLRRSLIEPATFILLVAGWFSLPGGPRFWTLVTLCLLFLPIYLRLLFALIRAAWNASEAAAKESLADFGMSHVSILLNIAFLAHQTMVALDAIIRTIIRSTLTHSRLLEWETATEAELGIRKRTPVDIYLDWVPILAVPIGVASFFSPGTEIYVLPFVVAWSCSKLISLWLNRSPHAEDFELTDRERAFLREVSLRTWRYFCEFSNEKNHWFIPDNVQQEPYRVAERLSPTNLGLLLNSRQAALEFGYLTLSEFITQTERTLASMQSLPRHFGHFLNWYDNITLAPLEPQFVSSVDSGNLAASLWSLKNHCLELGRRPVLNKSLAAAVGDYYNLAALKTGKQIENLRRLAQAQDSDKWLANMLEEVEPALNQTSAPGNKDQLWWHGQTKLRLQAIREEAARFAPWALPEYAALRVHVPADLAHSLSALTPENADRFYTGIGSVLRFSVGASVPADLAVLAGQIQDQLSAANLALAQISARLRKIASDCDRLVREMDFEMLIDQRRRLLSVGYDVASKKLANSCYDLLASEARIGTFIGVAKGQASQETWFRLGRQHTVCERETVLISWTGTMFEYLMPVIWMRSHPNTLLDRSVRAAVRVQQSYARARRVPWGVSEAAYSKTDELGNYQYAAFGVPGLALNVARAGSLVISPYSTCLALLVDPAPAVENLHRMKRAKWLAEYGFYESADFTPFRARTVLPRKYNLVRCWMSHHQGMTLASTCNLFHNSAFQRWFHAEPLVQASELILQERPLRTIPVVDTQPRRVLGFVRDMQERA